MSGTVLIAYASKHGSTQEVAHAVAEELQAHGLDVETLPAREVEDLRPYAGVVVGGSIYMGRWHPDATGLLARHKYALEALPLAVFGMGPKTLEQHDVDGAHGAAAPVACERPRGRAGRRRHLRRRDRPELAPLPVQPHAGERCPRLVCDSGLGRGSRRDFRLRETRIGSEGSPQRASADAPMS